MSISHDRAAELVGAVSSLLRAGRTAAHRHASELGAAGTSLGVLKVLSTGGARPSDLAARLHVGAPVVSRAVAPLERDGLVERTPDPTDARACLLTLTALGRRRLDAVQDAYVERVRSRLERWSDEHVTTATEILAALEQSLGEEEQRSATELTRTLITAGTAAGPPAAGAPAAGRAHDPTDDVLASSADPPRAYAPAHTA